MPNSIRIAVQRLSPRAQLPRRQTAGASGWDLHACLEEDQVIQPGARAAIPSGIAVAVPEGYELQIRPRSGLAWRQGVTIVNTPGTIDADYRGEIKILLVNLGSEPFRVRHGDRVGQMILSSVPAGILEEVEELSATERGAGGFGHTGLGDGEIKPTLS
ncbi:MAG: dUTP diphosphatase [Candidatus Eisenbacteria bacterium]|uniref:Deoxyuridine 5'-triphosphate nucleotidohydrolase n=1 Tax=Eiseniibacteriota bacterium TaxID=2212470 RepID=A0A948W5N9_UNCEI|nr:dUTP diphosphatase [Candidatus Eisenbacteria bacterium]MBU1950138.1 dUTP diphosphatase [Candidatus Eisenbacteria bacterium]MBU2690624.1 dUTP diphosphatase [Candidatus Eisenbacteria bacterium]